MGRTWGGGRHDWQIAVNGAEFPRGRNLRRAGVRAGPTRVKKGRKRKGKTRTCGVFFVYATVSGERNSFDIFIPLFGE